MAAQQRHIIGVTTSEGERAPYSDHHGVRSPHAWLIAIDAFLALGAIPGGLLLLLFPSDGGPLNLDPAYLEGSPFNNYLVPGLVLTGVGVGSAAAVVLHLRHTRFAAHVSLLLGLLIMGFELVEAAFVPFNLLQPFYFVVGLTMAELATALMRASQRRAANPTKEVSK